jgi:hypothetical protein
MASPHTATPATALCGKPAPIVDRFAGEINENSPIPTGIQPLSNSLTDLAERIRATVLASSAAEMTAIKKAIEAGSLLIEAKGCCRHGDWLPFLQRAGMRERNAQRYMKLAKSGLKSDTVSDLGGIKATLRWCEALRLPDADEFLLVSLDNFSSPITKPFATIWQQNCGHVFFVFRTENRWLDKLNKPIIKSEFVLPAVWSALDHRYKEMTFRVVKHDPDEFDNWLETNLIAAEADLFGANA